MSASTGQYTSASHGISSVPRPLPPTPQGTNGIVRKPVGSKADKPLGARPQPSSSPIFGSHPLPNLPTDESTTGATIRRKGLPNENRPSGQPHPPLKPQRSSEDMADHTESGTLTLIRRDPSSGEQWNVATIRDTPTQEGSASAFGGLRATKYARRGGAPLWLNVTNPSYRKFSCREENEKVTPEYSVSGEPMVEEYFRRRLYLPGTQAADQSGHRDHRSDSVNTFRQSEDGPRYLANRQSVDMTTNSTASNLTDRRNRGYSFASPWDSLCEFSTGASGKSLKCRHQVPGQFATSAFEVSELRFNLPTTSRSTPSDISAKRSSYFQGIQKRFGSFDAFEEPEATPTFAINENGRIDLTLGRERAGGGFGGRQAKLGKLIVHPEGFKMLDLLVAANIGLWWRAYERA